MTTTIDTAIEQSVGIRAHVHNAAKFLEARVGNSAVNPHAEWTLENNSTGTPTIHVRVSDDGVSAETTFTPHEISDFLRAKNRLYDLWFDLLGKRLELHDAKYRELASASSEE